MATALLTTVPVTVAALHAAADLLELAGDFLTDPTAQADFARFVDRVDPDLEAALYRRELLETAQLLRALADRATPGVGGTLRPGPHANDVPNPPTPPQPPRVSHYW